MIVKCDEWEEYKVTPKEREISAENFLGRLTWNVAHDAASLNF